jgi:hypothetical protein
MHPIIEAFLSVAGGQGKSTMSKNLAGSKRNARRVSVEEINEGDGTPDLQLRLAEFPDLVVMLKKFSGSENISVDFGASSAGSNEDGGLRQMLLTYRRTTATFNFWVVPVTDDDHGRDGGHKTVKLLRDVGVPGNKIVVLFNMLKVGTKPAELRQRFAAFFAYRDIGVHVCEVPIFKHEIIAKLRNRKRDDQDETVYSLAAELDSTDWDCLRNAARKAGDEQEVDAICEREAEAEAAAFACENLDQVWAATPLGASTVATGASS